MELELEDEYSPSEVINGLYLDHFILKLKVDFAIEISQQDLAREIRTIGQSYIFANRIPNLEKMRIADRKEYSAFQKSIARLREEMQGWDDEDMADFMADGARVFGELLPETHQHRRQCGKARYQEVLLCLGFMEKGVGLAAQRLTSEGGRPITNYGLEALTRKTADFWIDTLHRPFTVDYNREGSVSKAFWFVQTLVQAIDKIPDKKIISAVRAEQRHRTKLANQAKKLR